MAKLKQIAELNGLWRFQLSGEGFKYSGRSQESARELEKNETAMCVKDFFQKE